MNKLFEKAQQLGLQGFARILISKTLQNNIYYKQFTCTIRTMYKWEISLVCPNSNHDPIELPHKDPVFIGRSPETRIVDPRCSRKQGTLYFSLYKFIKGLL